MESRRSRSVSLGQAGIERLVTAVEAEHRRTSPGQRLTREGKAAILGGLSAATADKLLQGKTVDRATVELAFRSVGIRLTDGDLTDDPETIVENGQSQGPETDDEPITDPSAPARARSRAWTTLAVIATALMIVGALGSRLSVGSAGRTGPTIYDQASWAGTWRCTRLSVGTQSTGCPGSISHNGTTTSCTVQTWILNADGTGTIDSVRGKWKAANGYFTLILKGVPHDFFVSRTDTSFTLRYDVSWHNWSEYYTYERE